MYGAMGFYNALVEIPFVGSIVLGMVWFKRCPQRDPVRYTHDYVVWSSFVLVELAILHLYVASLALLCLHAIHATISVEPNLRGVVNGTPSIIVT